MLDFHLTPVQKQILWAVIENNGFPVTGLYQLALNLDIDYRWARRCVRQLERAGLLCVVRPYGREMYLMARTINSYWEFRGLLWGPVSLKIQNTKHKTQNGEIKMDPIASLRASLSSNEPPKYPRPELSEDEANRYSQVAAKLNSVLDQRLRLTYVAALVYENVRLLKEVNEHRQARGFDPLPVYDPEKK